MGGMGTAFRIGALLAAAALISMRAPAANDVPTAVASALGFLTEKTLAWKEDHSCASCHHAPMMLWSAELARGKGYAVDEDAVATVRGWLLNPDNDARLLPAPDGPADRDLFAPAAALATLALRAGPQDDAAEAAIARFAKNYVTHQERDGSTLINGAFTGTAPILEGGAIGTLLASLAYGPVPGAEAEARRGAVWLAVYDAPPTQQELALRMLVAARSGHAEALPTLAAPLLALQRGDGGWAQTTARASDAYATGQALVALAAAGQGPKSDAVLRGLRFLLDTQRPAGDWPMLSRNIKAGDTAPRENEPIVAAGTGWALLGILSVTEPKE